MKKIILLLSLITSTFSIAQESEVITEIKKMEVTTFKDGSYTTFKDFTSQNSVENVELTINSTDSLAYRFTTADGKKYNKPEAIVFEGIPYFRIKSIYKYFEKGSKGQGYDGGNYYLKANVINNKLTFRDYFSSNTAGLLGGLSGALAARRQKVLMFNQETTKFKIFKSYKNLEEYVKENFPDKISLVEQTKEDKNLKDEADKVEFILKHIL